jgi:xanthine/uracil/vitamin C permease (AzgA family)
MSPLTVFAESAVGIREGGRTGICSLMVAFGAWLADPFVLMGVCFLDCLDLCVAKCAGIHKGGRAGICSLMVAFGA